jgi:hypothetical protein
MDLQIEQRERHGVVIVDLKGRLVASDVVSPLQRLLVRLEHTRRSVIVNLKEITEIEANGLDAVVFSAMGFREYGGRLVVLGLGQTDPNFPRLANVNVVPEAYQEEADAVASFFLDAGRSEQ